MKQYQIAEAKRCFSEILERVEGGELVLIVRGKEHESVAYVVHPSMLEKRMARELGALEHWGEIGISDDWGITDEVLVG